MSVLPENFTAAQWAWEFLRRNPLYQAEWRAFWKTWQALEAEYGRPPDRDFCAWKRDPRAWVPAAECPGGDCRIDGDKVLIECAMGARWGFHKFPPSPDDDDPVGEGRLSWREQPEVPLPQLGAADGTYLGDDIARVGLGFDLSLPLPPQLERAKRQLQLLRRQRVREQGLQIQSVAANRVRWSRLLALWDARMAGADEATQCSLLDDESLEATMEEVTRLVNGGYLGLLRLPEK